jgi:hypothetical protein
MGGPSKNMLVGLSATGVVSHVRYAGDSFKQMEHFCLCNQSTAQNTYFTKMFISH